MYYRQYVQPEITISNFLEEHRSVISPLLLDIFRRLQYIIPFHNNNIFYNFISLSSVLSRCDFSCTKIMLCISYFRRRLFNVLILFLFFPRLFCRPLFTCHPCLPTPRFWTCTNNFTIPRYPRPPSSRWPKPFPITS